MFEDTLSLLYCFRNRRVQDRYRGLYLTCNLWIGCNKSQRFDVKKEDIPKLVLKTCSETDSDVLKANLAIFLNWGNKIFILFQCYGFKAKIELQESGGNCLIKSFFYKLMITLRIHTNWIKWDDVVSFSFTLICLYISTIVVNCIILFFKFYFNIYIKIFESK